MLLIVSPSSNFQQMSVLDTRYSTVIVMCNILCQFCKVTCFWSEHVFMSKSLVSPVVSMSSGAFDQL